MKHINQKSVKQMQMKNNRILQRIKLKTRIHPYSSSAYPLSSPTQHAGSEVERIDPLRFLRGCCKRRLNQALSIFLFRRVFCECCCFNIRAPLCVALRCICMCSVFWLLWFSVFMMPSDWLERLL